MQNNFSQDKRNLTFVGSVAVVLVLFGIAFNTQSNIVLYSTLLLIFFSSLIIRSVKKIEESKKKLLDKSLLIFGVSTFTMIFLELFVISSFGELIAFIAIPATFISLILLAVALY